MARKCEVCGKGKTYGNKISFSNRKNRRGWSPNIKSVRAIVDGSTRRIKVCTRCIRSGYVERAL